MEDKIQVKLSPGQERVLIQYQEPKEYVKPGQHYQLKSTQAVIDLINKRGSAETTEIFYLDEPGNAQVEVILDDKILSREQQQFDRATYRFEYSGHLKEWSAYFGKYVGQQDFIKYLKRCVPEEFPMVDQLLTAIQQLKIATQKSPAIMPTMIITTIPS